MADFTGSPECLQSACLVRPFPAALYRMAEFTASLERLRSACLPGSCARRFEPVRAHERSHLGRPAQPPSCIARRRTPPARQQQQEAAGRYFPCPSTSDMVWNLRSPGPMIQEPKQSAELFGLFAAAAFCRLCHWAGNSDLSASGLANPSLRPGASRVQRTWGLATLSCRRLTGATVHPKILLKPNVYGSTSRQATGAIVQGYASLRSTAPRVCVPTTSWLPQVGLDWVSPHSHYDRQFRLVH